MTKQQINLQMLGDRILVKPFIRKSSIITMDSGSENKDMWIEPSGLGKAEVISIGPKVNGTITGESKDMKINKGDIVWCFPNMESAITHNEEPYFIFRETQIIAKEVIDSNVVLSDITKVGKS